MFKVENIKYTVLFLCCAFLIPFESHAADEPAPVATPNVANTTVWTQLKEFAITKEKESTTILLLATTSVKDYVVKTFAGTASLSPRMYIDINNVDSSSIPASTPVNTSLEKISATPRGSGARITFHSKSKILFRYTVQPDDLGLRIVIDETNQTSAKKKTKATDMTLEKLLDSSEALTSIPPELITEPQAEADIPPMPGEPSQQTTTTTFAGYERKRINVDFFKIDLHNVFRLFREISGLNIIVDEGVSGSLTLNLKDVPWDFALDVILNLKGLEKEERFGTIVIYPKGKAFSWPKQARGSLTIERTPAAQELIIESVKQQPREVLQAKELLRNAQKEEKRGNFQAAIAIYTKASQLWPRNSQIPTRISGIFLTNLGLNAKAFHYAKEALKIKRREYKAALYAAISAANMGRVADASEYFRLSVSQKPPKREALASFAAFNENNGNNKAALAILRKMHNYYGETVESMTAIARIYDKQGQYAKADQQYKALLNSGFPLRASLRQYIQNRINN